MSFYQRYIKFNVSATDGINILREHVLQNIKDDVYAPAAFDGFAAAYTALYSLLYSVYSTGLVLNRGAIE